MNRLKISFAGICILATTATVAMAADPVKTGKAPFMIDTKTGRKFYVRKPVHHHMVSHHIPANANIPSTNAKLAPNK